MLLHCRLSWFLHYWSVCILYFVIRCKVKQAGVKWKSGITNKRLLLFHFTASHTSPRLLFHSCPFIMMAQSYPLHCFVEYPPAPQPPTQKDTPLACGIPPVVYPPPPKMQAYEIYHSPPRPPPPPLKKRKRKKREKREQMPSAALKRKQAPSSASLMTAASVQSKMYQNGKLDPDLIKGVCRRSTGKWVSFTYSMKYLIPLYLSRLLISVLFLYSTASTIVLGRQGSIHWNLWLTRRRRISLCDCTEWTIFWRQPHRPKYYNETVKRSSGKGNRGHSRFASSEKGQACRRVPKASRQIEEGIDTGKVSSFQAWNWKGRRGQIISKDSKVRQKEGGCCWWDKEDE